MPKTPTRKGVVDGQAPEHHLAAAAISLLFDTGEAQACALIRFMLAAGTLAEAWDLPPIVRAQPEVRFPRGRADFVFHHDDGSLSIVEVKALAGDSTILAGIGQLALYASQVVPKSTVVRRILAAPTGGPEGVHLHRAAREAGVIFEPLTRLCEVIPRAA